MTPEERVSEYYWWVVRRIKEEILTSPQNSTIRYELSHVGAAGVPNNETEENILRQLEEIKALKILNDPSAGYSRKIFDLQIIQPKFDRIYEERRIDAPSNKKDNEKEIDEWLDTKDSHTLGRMLQVANALNYEWQLRDENTFNVPHDKFQKYKINSEHDLGAILTTLHKKNFLVVKKMVSMQAPPDKPDVPQLSLWATIADDPKIINDSHTKISIIPERFRYLFTSLQVRVTQEKKQGATELEERTGNNEIQWSDKLKWQGDLEFLLGKKGRIVFGKNASDRIIIFKMLTEARGDWVTVKKMADKIGKSEGNVRVIIGQINKEYLESTIIEIVERNDKNEQGAYRIELLIPQDRL